jgi:hypothetical protein
MRRVPSARCAASFLFALAAVPVLAQEGETRISLVVSPTRLDFAPGFGGGAGGVSAELRVTRYFSRAVGAQVSALGVMAASQSAALGLCVPGATNCVSERRSPSALWGGLVSGIGVLGETGLRASLGAGGFRAAGYREGTSTSAGSSALGLGAEWVPSGSSRFTPTLGVRAIFLATPIAGMRQIYLPGVGVTF